MGFVHRKGFKPATNFLVKINSVVYSEKYQVKGGLLILKIHEICPLAEMLAIFICLSMDHVRLSGY